MKKIVVGYDGTEQAMDALHFGADLRRATGAELVVAPVDEIEPMWGDFNLEKLNENRSEYFRRMFDEAAEHLGDSAFERVVASGSASAALHQVAENERPDVLVIGSTHRAGSAKVLPGATGNRLLSGAPCAIAIAPKGYATTSSQAGVRRIGVAYDGQHESDLALDAAIDLARQSAATLRLVAVSPSPVDIGHGRGGGGSAYAFVDYLARHLDERLAEGMSRVPAETSSSTVIRQGRVAEVLIDEAKDLDLLVMGSRGYGPVRRVLLGGVAHKVMQAAPCPVMVVPRSAEKATRKAESHRVTEILV